jgi:hypothetical protein
VSQTDKNHNIFDKVNVHLAQTAQENDLHDRSRDHSQTKNASVSAIATTVEPQTKTNRPSHTSLEEMINARIEAQLASYFETNQNDWYEYDGTDENMDYDEQSVNDQDNPISNYNNMPVTNYGNQTPGEICSPETEENNCPDFLMAELNNYKGRDRPGPALKTSHLTTLFNDMLSKDLPEEILNEKCSKYNRPDNVEKLTLMKINKPLWRKVSQETKNRDLKAQAFQKTFLKAMVPIMLITDEFVQAQNSGTILDLSDCIKKAIDSLAMMCQVNRDINTWRKANLQPELNPEFRQLCTEKAEEEEPWLFENLKDKLKDLSETEKLTLSLKQGYRAPQYGRNYQTFPRRGRFQNNFRPQSNYGAYRGTRGGALRGNLRKRPYPIQFRDLF